MTCDSFRKGREEEKEGDGEKEREGKTRDTFPSGKLTANGMSGKGNS